MRKFTAETQIDMNITGEIVISAKYGTNKRVDVLNSVLNYIKDDNSTIEFEWFTLTINHIERGYVGTTVTVEKNTDGTLICHGSKELLEKAVNGFYIKEISSQTEMKNSGNERKISFSNY